MKPAELKEMEVTDLTEKEKELRKELFNLRFQQKMGQSPNTMRIRLVRRDIARILTFTKMNAKVAGAAVLVARKEEKKA
ncbi:MAG: 50S ribosomal protein L29 [Nitrospirota bacterium]